MLIHSNLARPGMCGLCTSQLMVVSHVACIRYHIRKGKPTGHDAVLLASQAALAVPRQVNPSRPYIHARSMPHLAQA